MILQGTITNVKGASEFNGNSYQFAELHDGQGGKSSVMFINRDIGPLANQNVTITDTSQEQNKIIRPEPGKKYDWKVYGTGVEITGAGGAVVAAQQPVQQQRPAPQLRQASSANADMPMEEVIAFGMACVNIGLAHYPNAPGELQAAIFNCSMYGLKEGRALNAPGADQSPSVDPLVASAQNILEASPMASQGATGPDHEANPFAGDDGDPF